MILTVRRPGNKTTSNLRDCTGTYNDINSEEAWEQDTSNLRDCTGTYNDINSEEAWEQDYL